MSIAILPFKLKFNWIDFYQNVDDWMDTETKIHNFSHLTLIYYKFLYYTLHSYCIVSYCMTLYCIVLHILPYNWLLFYISICGNVLKSLNLINPGTNKLQAEYIISHLGHIMVSV